MNLCRITFADSQLLCPTLRQSISDAFHSDDLPDLRSLLTDQRCRQALEHPAAVVRSTRLMRNHPNKSNFQLLTDMYAKPYANGGIWLDEPAIRALAVSSGTNIIVIPPDGPVYVYPKSLGIYHIVGTDRTFTSSTEASIYCIDHNNQDFLPSLAFDHTTIAICYNGSNHFWATQLSTKGESADWSILRSACPLPIYDLVLLV